ncbi:MAG: DMT family transporter [bacterium]|nr:DMT family transporter [bacterium]
MSIVDKYDINYLMWIYLALFSALVYSLRSIVEKKSLVKIDKYVLAFGLRIFALPFFVIPFILNPSLLVPINDISILSWIAIIFVSVISSPIEVLFFYKALQMAEVTELVPLLSITPIFTMLFNLLIFHSYPSAIGLLGVLIIIVAIYVLNITKLKEGIFQPFLHLYHDRASRYLALMMIFNSLGVVIDKLAISGTNPYYYALINYSLLSITLAIIVFVKAKNSVYQIKNNFKTFLLLGLIVFMYTIPRNFAISGSNAGYVAAVLSSSVIFSTIIGLVFFKEKNMFIKLASSMIAFLGISIIKLFG